MGDAVGYRCDDPSDCKSGETCCIRYTAAIEEPSEAAAGEHAVCLPSREAFRCQQELCVQGAAPCPRGMACLATEPREGGTCEAPQGPATCAGGKRCPKDKPICAKSAQGFDCVSANSPEFRATAIEDRYGCTRQQDCAAPTTCSFVSGEYWPADSLYTYCGRGAAWGMVARTVCDPKGPNCRRDPKLPPWMGSPG